MGIIRFSDSTANGTRQSPSPKHHAAQVRKSCRRRRIWRDKEVWQGPEVNLLVEQGVEGWLQEAQEGVLRHLHLQGPEAGASRHWHLVQGHVHHELVRE